MQSNGFKTTNVFQLIDPFSSKRLKLWLLLTKFTMVLSPTLPTQVRILCFKTWKWEIKIITSKNERTNCFYQKLWSFATDTLASLRSLTFSSRKGPLDENKNIGFSPSSSTSVPLSCTRLLRNEKVTKFFFLLYMKRWGFENTFQTIF